jgi:hypothetical protein
VAVLVLMNMKLDRALVLYEMRRQRPPSAMVAPPGAEATRPRSTPGLGVGQVWHGVFPPEGTEQCCVSSVCTCVLGRRVPRFLGQSHLYLSVRSV